MTHIRSSVSTLQAVCRNSRLIRLNSNHITLSEPRAPMDIANEECYLICNVQRNTTGPEEIGGLARHARSHDPENAASLRAYARIWYCAPHRASERGSASAQ